MCVDLLTKQGEELRASRETPWDVYPRPQMRRESYVNLNGEWAFSSTEDSYQDTICVPFCPESQLSGIGRHFSDSGMLCYRRKFSLPEGFQRGRVLLHFGAVDQEAVVFVNNQRLGAHTGGYEAFSLDITHALQAENELVVMCRDDLQDQSYPYGKQTLKRGGMWYTPVSGIWQTVWLESVPSNYIQKLNIENRGYAVTISIEPKLPGKVTVAGLGTYILNDGSVTITPENPNLWSPENPYLYDFTVETEEDRVESYFAIRSLEIQKMGDYPRLCLNGKPYFFHGLLDQGYWPDGIFTPAKPECYAEDILAMKALGFNMLRKHIKVEPEEFYYQCDKLGMVVFQDMVNNGPYHFLRDTVLPTIGLQKRNDRNLHKDARIRQGFYKGMEATVGQLKNHPCICYWTIFNEGWGQFDHAAAYARLRELDTTRFIDSVSGWFLPPKGTQLQSDVESPHVYFKPIRLEKAQKPLVLSEFGGYSHRVAGHCYNTVKNYGYRNLPDPNAFADALEALYINEVLPAINVGLCAAVYTQLSDVEDETNGLLTFDRRVMKVDAQRMRDIADRLLARYGK